MFEGPTRCIARQSRQPQKRRADRDTQRHGDRGIGGCGGSEESLGLLQLTLREEGRPDGASVFHSPAKASRIGAAFALVLASGCFPRAPWVQAERHHFDGDRAAVRHATVGMALHGLIQRMQEPPTASA